MAAQRQPAMHVSEEKNMADKPKDEIIHDHNHDGIDRRGFLKCMAWVGTGVLFTMTGGILRSETITQITAGAGALKGALAQPKGALSLVQISDSHIGFSKEANKDV